MCVLNMTKSNEKSYAFFIEEIFLYIQFQYILFDLFDLNRVSS